EFFLGVKLALVFREGQLGVRKRSWPLFTFCGLLTMIISLAMLSLICKYNGIDNATDTAGGLLVHHFVLPAGIVLFFYGLIAEASFVGMLLGSKLSVLLGRSSYAFYLLHVGLFASVSQKYITSNLFLLFILLQLASIALYIAIEKPVTVFLRKKLV